MKRFLLGIVLGALFGILLQKCPKYCREYLSRIGQPGEAEPVEED